MHVPRSVSWLAAGGHLGGFHLLALMPSAAVHVPMEVSVGVFSAVALCLTF